MKIFVGKCTLFFPILFLVGLAMQLYAILHSYNAVKLLVLILYVYLLPILVFRFVRWVLPYKKGLSELSLHEEGFHWFSGFRVQTVYEVLPILERLLRIVPPIYSAWLRLWGSKIGKNVKWTFTNDVYDRADLTIGDDTLIGSHVTISQHTIIKKKNGVFMVHYEPVVIGSKVLIGANTEIGPGTQIEDGAYLNFGTRCYGDRRMSDMDVMMTLRKMKNESKF